MCKRLKLIPSYSYEKREIEEHLKEYVDKISLPEIFRRNIASSQFLHKNPGYYIDYPFLFLKSSQDGEEKVKDLCVASVLYYQSIIILDSVLDKELSISEQFPIFMCCQEESIKILSRYFPIESLFWEKWNLRKLEYLRAYKNDKRHNVNSIEDFVNHADNKSAIGKVAIDALYYMGLITSQDIYKKYLLMHRYYYTAFQIFDDIMDVREDLKSGQFNIMLWKIKQNIQKGIYCAEILDDVNALIRTMYEDKIVDEFTTIASTYIEKSMKMAKEEGLDYFYAETCRMWNMMVNYQNGIEAYFYDLHISGKLSVNKQAATSISSSIDKALDFIECNQETDGHWRDLCVRNNICDNFSTAFILLMLKESQSKTTSAFRLAESYIKNIKKDTLWGKNLYSFSDNMTSILSMLALNDINDIQSLCNRLNEDGGISALYNKMSLLSSFPVAHEWETNTDGWLQSHVCVSSSLLYLFAKNGYLCNGYDKLTSFIKKQIISNVDLAYWWIDDIYTMYFLAKANEYIKDDEIYCFIQKKTKEKLDCVKDMDSTEYNYFFLSLLLYLLCYVGKMDEALYICEMITKNQFSDGSWPESNFMCIPGMDVVSPKDSINWRVSDFGMNVRARDFHRLLTTSTVIMALSEFQKHGKI